MPYKPYRCAQEGLLHKAALISCCYTSCLGAPAVLDPVTDSCRLALAAKPVNDDNYTKHCCPLGSGPTREPPPFDHAPCLNPGAGPQQGPCLPLVQPCCLPFTKHLSLPNPIETPRGA